VAPSYVVYIHILLVATVTLAPGIRFASVSHYLTIWAQSRAYGSIARERFV
jgi:hypothetical protein